MQITGGYRCVQNALHKITSRIRDNLYPNEVLAEARTNSNFQVNKDIAEGNFSAHGKSAFPLGRFMRQVFFTSFELLVFQFLLCLFLVFHRVLWQDYLRVFIFAECWGAWWI